MIYFTSDTHYNHKNICKGTTSWEGINRTRNFDTLEQMNDAIVSGINLCVKSEDELWHLGDWSFGGLKSVYDFKDKLICKNIHLVFGNHDQHIEDNKDLGDYYPSTQGLFSSVQYYKELKVNGVHIILSHYAHRVWNKSHKGSIMLYGHSHGTLDQMTPEISNPTWIGDQYFIKNYKTMDVGIDTHPKFRPYSFTEILEIMNKKEVLLGVDHHNKETN